VTKFIVILFFQIFLFRVEDVKAEAACPYPFFQDMLRNIQETNESVACKELDIGQSKIVNFSDYESPTRISHKYEIIRKAEKEYRIRLNLVFLENSLRGAIFKKQNVSDNEEMSNKVRECLEQLNQHLRGPNGENISIELIGKEEAREPKYQDIANPVHISREKVDRETRQLYSLQSSCPTLAHELMHLLGLVDEYTETIDTNLTRQDCRSKGPIDSIMHDHQEAFDFEEIFQQKQFEKRCVCKQATCPAFSQNTISQLKSCPEGYDMESTFSKLTSEGVKFKQLQNASNAVGSTCLGGVGLFTSKPCFVLSVQSSGKIPNSILYPAHFKAIIFPGCQKANSTYYKCARDAYFRPYKIINSCHLRPEACSDPLMWLQ